MFGCITMEKYGFRFTNDIVALVTLIYAITYLYIGDGWASFSKIKHNKERLIERKKRRLARQ